jgi:hypothetical protein
MDRGSNPSRRTLLRSLLGGLSLARFCFASPEAPQPEGVSTVLAGFRRTAFFQRRYRVTATVTALGIRIFSRSGVGGGYAAVELGEREGATCSALQFAAGSLPDRAAGLNRFGILREARNERAGAVQSAFAGFITSSKEEGFAEARKALKRVEGGVPVVAAWGSASGHQGLSHTAHLDLPSTFTWTQSEAVLEDLLKRGSGEPPKEHRAADAGGFLGAMRRAAYVEGSFRTLFLHNSKLYELRTHRKDAALDGEVRNDRQQTTAEFQAFYDSGDDSGLPAKFEYHPRSYLRLMFEADSAPAPEIPSLLASL